MPDDDPDENLVSRSDKRRAEKTREDALARLARELVVLGKKQLERLGLPDAVLDALDEARPIKSARARERQLRVVRGTLRDGDWPAIRARLDSLQKHGVVNADAADERARAWVVRLVGEGTPALDELIGAHPNADRQHLRQLVRNAQQTSPTRRKRAEEKLAGALASLLDRE